MIPSRKWVSFLKCFLWYNFPCFVSYRFRFFFCHCLYILDILSTCLYTFIPQDFLFSIHYHDWWSYEASCQHFVYYINTFNLFYRIDNNYISIIYIRLFSRFFSTLLSFSARFLYSSCRLPLPPLTITIIIEYTVGFLHFIGLTEVFRR